jgi:hypothetical protein
MQFSTPLGNRLVQLAALAILSLSATAHASFTLKWVNRDLPANESGFIIQRSDAGASFVPVGLVSPTTTTFQDTTATRAIAYAYRVCTYNAGGDSLFTNTVTNAPLFSAQPSPSQTLTSGGNLIVSATAAGFPAPTYQWQVSVDHAVTWTNVANSAGYIGATQSTLIFLGIPVGFNQYQFRAVATNAGGSATSTGQLLTVIPNAIGLQPLAQNVAIGANVVFTAAGASSISSTYQWQVSTTRGVTWTNLTNAGVYANVTSAALAITGASAGMNGNLYRVVVTNAYAPAGDPSLAVDLGVGASASGQQVGSTPSAPPSFTAQPGAQLVAGGTTVVFAATAAGSPAPQYQWRWNGAAISGATAPRLVLMGATAATAGAYTCSATNYFGTVTSAAATLSFTTTTNVGRLLSFSVLNAAAASQPLTLGFALGGAGTSGSDALLVRAIGPALGAVGVAGFLPDPTLTVTAGSTVIAANDNWGSPASNQAPVTAADSAVGALPLTDPTSLDAAIVATVADNAVCAVQIGGNGAAVGTVLAEVDDTLPVSTYTLVSPRLVRLSSRAQVSANGAMTAGFTLGGTTAKTVLIRALGPTLTASGYANGMLDPQVSLNGTVAGSAVTLAANVGWVGDPQIAAAGTGVGAAPLTSTSSHDAAVLMTLAPGAYTAVATSSSESAGLVQVEIYEIP